MSSSFFFFFFNDTATTEIYTLSLHDALPIFGLSSCRLAPRRLRSRPFSSILPSESTFRLRMPVRSEKHTSELQSRQYLVCRLLLEKKKNNIITRHNHSHITVSDDTFYKKNNI